MRLHELTKELDADSKRMLALAKELGLGVKSHSSNIPAGAEGILRAAWAEELAERAEAEAAKAKKKAAAEAEARAKEQPPEPAEPELVQEPPAAEEPVEQETEVRAPPDIGAAVATIRITTEEQAEEKRREVVETQQREQAEAQRLEQAEAQRIEQAETQRLEQAEIQRLEQAEAQRLEQAEAQRLEKAEAQAAAAAAEVQREAAPPEGEPAVDEDLASKTIAVTVGGHAVGEAETEQATEPEAEPEKPKKRRGARILGRIELKPEAIQRPSKRSAPSEYDPLDPTRPPPPRRHGTTRKTTSTESEHAGGRKSKDSREYVFDPEDSTTLSAIRLSNFGTRRRLPVRRPPPRRTPMIGVRRSRKATVKPTHAIQVRPPIAVRDLADELGTKTREILQHFPGIFDPRDKNAILEEEHLLSLSVALDREITVLQRETEEERFLRQEDERRQAMAEEPQPRAPVVAVLGHVDHGKTTLLDTLRRTEVAKHEAGGITQRTSAYLVRTAQGHPVCFLDTPGHKAFTEMRARGAHTTDVAVLVVAADDGVMEQTKEAIEHARAAGVPLVVAINKVDLPSANPSQVRQQLASAGVMVEDWGGEVGVVECSALDGTGVDRLIERLALETEILELKADPSQPARGVVVDSLKDPDMGIVATVVVKNGTLRPKDAVIAGNCVGRVRYLLDDTGKRVKEAGPSTPVQVFGLEEPPKAGTELIVVEDINQARMVVKERVEVAKTEITAAPDVVTLENLFETIEATKVHEINVVLKADVQGTLEVLRRSTEEISHPEVKFKVIRGGVGAVTEEDVLLAQASHAFVIGFAVRADAGGRAAVSRTGVDVKYYDVIYEMTENLRKALEGELGVEEKETVVGHATVRAVFKSSKFGSIAGCYVTDGVVSRDNRVRLLREGKTVYAGRLDSLRRFKEDAREVRENYECGAHIENFDDVKVDDVIEAFEITEVKRTLESAPLG